MSSIIIIIAFLTLFSSTFEPTKATNKSCIEFDDIDYDLFGTKTDYDYAVRYIKRNHQSFDSFGDLSLEEEHSRLKLEKCKAKTFYFVGRHSARFPDAEKIVRYNEDAVAIRDKLQDRMKSDEACLRNKNIRSILSWRPKMFAKLDNLVTHIGEAQERDIATRFKLLYPQFFNTSSANVSIGVTNKIRTSQTGAAFLREVHGFNLPGCEPSSIPTNNITAPLYDVDKVVNGACYALMTRLYAEPKLVFYDECKRISGEKKEAKDKLVQLTSNPQVLSGIVQRVSQKLSSGNETNKSSSFVDADVIDSIYNMCRYENVFQANSVWCSLFEESDLSILDYINDVKIYIKEAYGPRAKPKQACPMMKDLLNSLEAGKSGALVSKFYFTHELALKKLLAAMQLFKDDQSFSEQSIINFVKSLQVPRWIQWRSSVIAPFSANIAHILYECNDNSYKILTTVNEQPVKVGGCKGKTQCDAKDFFKTYDHMKDCNLNTICMQI